MLGTNRNQLKKDKNHASQRIQLDQSTIPKKIESHTRSFTCTKYEKFFHYYTVCGVLVQVRGAIEKVSTATKDRKEGQLIYKNSKEPVYLQVCNENNAEIDQEQQCDVDLLIDDNALRMSSTKTAHYAAQTGDAIDGEQLLKKCKEKVESPQNIDLHQELKQFFQTAVRRNDFCNSIDAEKPHQFLANNLIDLVLSNSILSEHICVYLVPIPELRRTRVQFYWCVRETKTPFCPIVAKWMLQNYVDRHGPLFQDETTSTPTEISKKDLLGEIMWHPFNPNSTTPNDFVRPSLRKTTKNDVASLEFIRIDQVHASVDFLSQYSRNIVSQEIFDCAFLDDALVVDQEYKRYYDTHDLQNANQDVFRSKKSNTLVSTDEFYTFAFLLQDLKTYCQENKIHAQEEISIDERFQNESLRFECIVDNTDMLVIDDALQMAFRQSGFVILPLECDFEVTNGFAPRLDDSYCFYLQKSCRCTEVQLSLAFLCNYVARLEIERIEPFAYEPPIFNDATRMQEILRSAAADGNPIETTAGNHKDNQIFFTAQQAAAFRWIREREDAIKAVKERKILRSIAIASTGWFYDCLTCRLHFDENHKRKTDTLLQEEHFRLKRRRTMKNTKIDSKNIDGDNGSSDNGSSSNSSTSNASVKKEAFLYYVEAFNRNHLGTPECNSNFDLTKAQRVYQSQENEYDSLFISGGPASGKRVTVLAAVLYDLDPFWELKKKYALDQSWKSKKKFNTEASKLKYEANVEQAYFRHHCFQKSVKSQEQSISVCLTRTSLLYNMHSYWHSMLESNVSGVTNIYDDCSIKVANYVLEKIIASSHENVSIEKVFLEIWQSFMLLRPQEKLNFENGPTHQQETDMLLNLSKKEHLIVEQEPRVLRHCKLVSRATLLLCSENELCRWLQALQVFNREKIDDNNPCWRFVLGSEQNFKIDASIYVIESITDWQSFNVARCMLADIVIITYECLMDISAEDANYLQSFSEAIDSVKAVPYCSPQWMRCVKQHVSVVESTPCIGMLKTVADVEILNEKKRKKYDAMQQIPLECIRWQRAIIANLENANKNAQLHLRTTRLRHFAHVSNFLDNLRAVRRIYVDSELQTPRNFVDTIFPTMKAHCVTTYVGEPMIPKNLLPYKNRWQHNFGQRASPVEVQHLHPDMLLFYSRQFKSLAVMENHKLRNILNGGEKQKQSNIFVENEVTIAVPWPDMYIKMYKNMLAMMKLVQDQQAMHRANDSDIYKKKTSMSLYFTEIVGESSTHDIFRGSINFRAPANMFLSEDAMEHVNSTVSTAQASSIPTHVFANKNNDHFRLVRLLDRFDPVAWRDFYFSRKKILHSKTVDCSDLKPTYRFILNAITHAPHLSFPILQQLCNLLEYRDARLLSTMTRSSTDTPEFPFTTSRGAEILNQSQLQMDIAQFESNVLQQEASQTQQEALQTQQEALQTQQQQEQPQAQQQAQQQQQQQPQAQPPQTTNNAADHMTLHDQSTFDRWYQQMQASTTFSDNLDFSSPFCLELRSNLGNAASPIELFNASELNDYKRFLFTRVGVSLIDECSILALFKNFSRPDIATAVLFSEDYECLRTPVNRVELLSKNAVKNCHYQHVQVSMVDRCMFSICDAAINANKRLFYSILNRLETDVDKKDFQSENQNRSLSDPNFITVGGAHLVGSDEDLHMINAPLETQRLTRRSIVHDLKKLRKEFYRQFERGLNEFYLASIGENLKNVANESIFSTLGDETQSSTSSSRSTSLQNSENDDAVFSPQIGISHLNVGDAANIDIFEEEDFDADIFDENWLEEQPNLNNNDLQQQTNSADKQQAISQQPVVLIDKAIEDQKNCAKKVIERYIITERNLLFERRCKDWLIVRMIRDLDAFLANFNSHQFFRKMPLLCRMNEQFGEPDKEKTKEQENFCNLYRFHAENKLLRGFGDTQLQFTNSQINEMAVVHMRHNELILLPLIEMLIYSGKVHGNIRSVPSEELMKLFAQNNVCEMEQQDLLTKIVGGVRTSAPTYMINFISKFCHETKWIQRDLEFIRQQTERTLAALPCLAKLHKCLNDYRYLKKTDVFECPLCMESMCEAKEIALFPCGHMCCYSCHTACNNVLHRPKTDDVPIDVATAGNQCFLCRYLLQFDEKICKVSFSEAVSIVISKEEEEKNDVKQPVTVSITTIARERPTANERPIANERPTAATPATQVVENVEPFSYFDYDSSDCENSPVISQDTTLEPDQKSKNPEFLKTEPATNTILSFIQELVDSSDYGTRKVLICSSMLQALKNVLDAIKLGVAKSFKDKINVRFITLPLTYDDHNNQLEDYEFVAVRESKKLLIIYLCHLEYYFNVSRNNCLHPLLYFQDLDVIYMLETPMIRLVDDRASHMLAATLEQRFLSFFCNEFSQLIPTIYRFVIDHPVIQTVDKVWFHETRWYK